MNKEKHAVKNRGVRGAEGSSASTFAPPGAGGTGNAERATSIRAFVFGAGGMAKATAMCLPALMLACIMFLCVCLCAVPAHAGSKKVATYQVGKQTKNQVTATLYEDGSLVFSGTGDVAAYANPHAVPWYENRTQITEVTFESGVTPSTLDFCFYRCTALSKVDGIPSSVTSINYTFYNCKNLSASPSLPKGLTSMKNAFDGSGLTALPSIPSGVTNMEMAFAGCTKLKSISESFAIPDTVANVKSLFADCTALKSLPSGFAVPESATSLYGMFAGCTALEELPKGFTLKSTVTNLQRMFADCTALKSLPSGFTVPKNATTTAEMFSGCTALTSLPKGFTISSSTAYTWKMFENCTALKSLPSGFTIPTGAVAIQGMFYNCPKLTRLPSGFTIPTGASNKSQVFYVNTKTPLATAVSKTNDSLTAYNWAGDNRTLTGGTDMYRLYNPNSGEHFYTASTAEKDNLVNAGWNYEGVAWTAPVSSGTPVYRLYNPNPDPVTGSGEHHYTMSKTERDSLVKAGWKDEGTGWYSDDEKTTVLYRLYNPNAFNNNHHYTTSMSERNYLMGLGWKDEGTAWYGM